MKNTPRELHHSLLFLVISLLGAGSHADDSPLILENILVTGSRLDAASLPSSHTMTREDIERVNAASTTELLRQLPHVIMSQNGGVGGQSFLSIRGGEPNFTLVLLDGVAVNDPTNSRGGGFDFNQIDPAVIERIELYRGGISAIHGGEAISGVIHFITRSDESSSLAVAAGNDSQRRASVTLSKQLGASISGLLSASHNEQSRSAFNDYRNRQLLGKLGHEGERSTSNVLVTFSDQAVSAFAEDSGGNRFAVPRIAETRDSEQLVASLNSTFLASDSVSIDGRLAYSKHEEDADNPGIADGAISGIPASVIRSEFSRREAEVLARATFDSVWEGTAGINYRDLRGRNAGFLDFGAPVPAGFELEQSTAAVFAEISGTWDHYDVNLGVRLDDPEGFSREASSRLSARYRPTANLTTFASYSEGYKLPSFFALAHPLVGNPALLPERSKNREIGVRYSANPTLLLEATWFHNRFSELVDFDSNLFTNVNRSTVTAKGAELRLSGQINDWLSASLDAMYLSTGIHDSSDRLRRRPRWSGAIHLQARLDRFDARLSFDSRSNFNDSSVVTGPTRLDGFTAIRAAANWHRTNGLTLSVRINNILDTRREEAVGFIDTGRQLSLGARYRL